MYDWGGAFKFEGKKSFSKAVGEYQRRASDDMEEGWEGVCCGRFPEEIDHNISSASMLIDHDREYLAVFKNGQKPGDI